MMTRRPRTERLAKHLIRHACGRLPQDIREARYCEWTAEAFAILYDPSTRSRTRRTARALLYAADHMRGAHRLAKASRRPTDGSRLGARTQGAGPELVQSKRELAWAAARRMWAVIWFPSLGALLAMQVRVWTHAPNWVGPVAWPAGMIVFGQIQAAFLRVRRKRYEEAGN
jgi:hypothetical protein